MLRDIIAGILGREADLEVAGSMGADELAELTERTAPDIVIAGQDPAVIVAAERLLERFPRLRVLEVVGDGRSASVYELRPSREFVGDISPDSLLCAVRGRE